ncbi:hypothetical protein [Saccharomonospora sp. NB11]|uniref:hypothetical protein n=1 Tax=Saccharomonospora sp. NB11 TaxID=1642298 RepID=UPI0018D13F01|nr:hypothetical protein [Saccharomonospora sp. NB11]
MGRKRGLRACGSSRARTRLLPRPSHLPARITTGAFILNSGYSKWGADEATAGQLHGFAAGTYPPLKKLPPNTFVRLLSVGEMALGAALVVPVVPSVVAGASLTVFAAGLVGMYLKTPGMRMEGSLRPTQDGLSLAKDVWMLGIGASLVLDDVLERRQS